MSLLRTASVVENLSEYDSGPENHSEDSITRNREERGRDAAESADCLPSTHRVLNLIPIAT